MGKKVPAVVRAALERSDHFRNMLTHGNVNTVTQVDGDVPKKSSLLHIAIDQKDEEMVHTLLEKNIDVNIQNAARKTALMQAITAGASEDIQRQLIENSEANHGLQNLVCVLSLLDK